MPWLSQQELESVVTAAAAADLERGPPFRQGDRDRFRGAQVEIEHVRQATGAVDCPRLVSKMLPRDALGQVIGHDGQATTCRGSGRARNAPVQTVSAGDLAPFLSGAAAAPRFPSGCRIMAFPAC